MDWDKLRIFHAVAEAGSLTGGGETLNMSQSAVSRQIAALEESLGVALFRRHARGLVLTEQGESLFATAADIFEKLSVIKGQLKDTHDSELGPLSITVSEFIGSTWLAPQLAEFRRRYPTIQLTLLFDDRILNLNMKEADGAVRLWAPTEAGLIQRYLASIHFHICGHKDYFSKYGRPQSLRDLKDHTLIGFPQNVLGPFENPNWLFDKADVNTRTHNNLIMMNSMYAVHKAVSTGCGIAVLPDFFIADRPELEVILPELERPPVDMYFVYAEERKNSQRIIKFRDFLLDRVQKTAFTSYSR